MQLTFLASPPLPSPPRSTSSPQVNVTVGAGSTSQDAQITTAAALAESARQLAQSAAAFGEESDNVSVVVDADTVSVMMSVAVGP